MITIQIMYNDKQNQIKPVVGKWGFFRTSCIVLDLSVLPTAYTSSVCNNKISNSIECEINCD